MKRHIWSLSDDIHSARLTRSVFAQFGALPESELRERVRLARLGSRRTASIFGNARITVPDVNRSANRGPFCARRLSLTQGRTT
jgi:hypothetical protein